MSLADNKGIVNLKKIFDAINCGKRMQLKDGASFSLLELRPDGVHLSDKGTQYISELVADALESHQPRCASL